MTQIEKLEKQFLELKEQVTRMGMPINGSIQVAFLRCGKKNCHCQQPGAQKHGPYNLWYRREHGKLRTQSIDKEDLETYQTWISNREKLYAVVKKMEELGSAYAAVFKSTPRKSKKRLSEMRGK